MVTTGVIDEGVLERECGPFCMARWLTAACRLLKLYVSFNSLNVKDAENLKLVCQFIVSCYGPCWFEIKLKSLWTEGPNHLLSLIQKASLQPLNVQAVIKKYIKEGAYYSHSESVLTTMLTSQDREERLYAVKSIISIRAASENPDIGDLSPRRRTLTKNLNFQAKSLTDLLNCNATILEPPVTCKIPTAELYQIVEEPITVRPWVCHAQGCERAIRSIVDSGQHVSTARKRDARVLSQQYIRRLLKFCSRDLTKKQFLKMLDILSDEVQCFITFS